MTRAPCSFINLNKPYCTSKAFGGAAIDLADQASDDLYTPIDRPPERRQRSQEAEGPPPKRQRLMPGNMHEADRRSNGSLKKVNGHARGVSNGVDRFYGHDRQEVTRLLIQGLRDLGYDESASTLMHESGYELESPAVAAFRQSVLEGDWAEAESLLFGSGAVRARGFPLAEGVDEFDLRFQLRRQKYLELLEVGDHAGALIVLRQELTPLHRDTGQLHNLSGLMVCPSPKDLRTQAVWDGAKGSSRHTLLTQLSKAISASVMIPNHRLATLLSQVKQSQVSKCYYHNPLSQLSLFTDHTCDKDQFPLRTIQELSLKDEVFSLQFSHDGKLLAAAGQPSEITVFDTQTWKPAFTLTGHRHFVGYLAWSPDDTKLVSCSNDRTAKIWSRSNGAVLHTISNHNEPITAAVWTPDGRYLVTGSLDKKESIYQWTESASHAHTWSANYRVNALAISPDGNRLVALNADNKIHVYNFHTREELISMKLNTKLTCVNITRDSNYMLVNMAGHELQLIEIKSAEIAMRFIGQKQTEFMIRSTFGGSEEALVLSGSEDGKIYVYNKDRGILIEKLVGHIGSVNSVAWNPAQACMFASGGDDLKIKIWGKSSSNALQRTQPIPVPSSNRRGHLSSTLSGATL